MMYCRDCTEFFEVIFNNKPELEVEYCPLCGSEEIEYEKEEYYKEDEN